MCEELLQTGNGQGRADLRALVVPLEPPLSKGYHPCWDPQLRRVRLYSPKLAIMIRDEEGGMSVYVAAAIALFSASTLQGLSVLFLMAALSATMIWFTERNQKGIFREANKYPVPLLAGYGDAFYWSITTATSTGYGDKVPKSPIGKVWAMFWMLIGILLFALVGGSLTTDIIEYTAGAYCTERTRVSATCEQVDQNRHLPLSALSPFSEHKLPTFHLSSPPQTRPQTTRCTTLARCVLRASSLPSAERTLVLASCSSPGHRPPVSRRVKPTPVSPPSRTAPWTP